MAGSLIKIDEVNVTSGVSSVTLGGTDWDSSYNVKTPMCTPHTSFNLQGQNIKKNPRDSIEARIFMVLNK